MKITKALLLSLLMLGLLFIACGGDDDNNDNNNADYFPLADGNVWEFDKYTTENTTGDTTEVLDVQMKVDGIQTFNDVDYFRVYDLPDTQKTLYYQNDMYLLGVQFYPSIFGMLEIPFNAVQKPITVGGTWDSPTFDFTPYGVVYINGECRAQETITVPAGTFENCYHINIIYSSTLAAYPGDSINFWIAPDVGPVKFVTYEDSTLTYTKLLTNYNHN